MTPGPSDKRLTPSRLVALTAVVLAGYGAFWSVKKALELDFRALPKILGGAPTLDDEATLFEMRVSKVGSSSSCLPIHIGVEDEIGIFYLHCSDEALKKDAEPVAISEQFAIPMELARRTNFWRRVYSLWSMDEYVLHVGEYPEVALEIGDASNMNPKASAAERVTRAKKVLNERRRIYRDLLLSMHRSRNKPAAVQTPAMRRIAKIMAHIDDPLKYQRAAFSLRVQRGQRDFVRTGIESASAYLPAIDEEFKSRGLPVELARLAFVESSFNLKALSKVGASGVYQIMPSTGHQYLRIEGLIDERNDPIKASVAAAKLLELNYRLTGSWSLAITAYNHGVGGIKKAMAKTGRRDLPHLIEHYHGSAFGFASKNFYCEFLAMLATLKDADKYFQPLALAEPLVFTRIRLPREMAARQAMRQYKMSASDMQRLNPDLHWRLIAGGGVLPRGYVLKIPAPDDIHLTQAVKENEP